MRKKGVKNFIFFLKEAAKKSPFVFALFTLSIIALLFLEVWNKFSPLPAHDWLSINLKQIKISNPEDFSFAVFGDNKNSHFVFEKLLTKIENDRQISFAIDIGDLVYDGEKEKYRYFLKQIRRNFHKPFLVAMGNHELKGDGRGLYYEIFGPFFYSFKIGRTCFIVLDDANGSLGLWQREWLENELKNARDCVHRLVFMHIPLYDPRGGIHHHCLSKKTAEELLGLFKKYRVTYIFTSHIHSYFSGKWGGIPYIITGGAGAELWGTDPRHSFFHYLKLSVKGEKLNIKVVRLHSPDYEWIDRLTYAAWLYTYAFLRIHGLELALLLIVIGFGILIVHSFRKENNR